MRLPYLRASLLASAALLATLPAHVLAGDVLSSSGFTNCLDSATIKVNKANVKFDRASGVVNFDVSGTSSKEQKVQASLVVMAYGKEVYTKDFDPCDPAAKVEQLCPGMYQRGFGLEEWC